MDAMFKSTLLAMDAVFGEPQLPPAPRIDGETTREDEPAHLTLEYRVNADDYCELVNVFVNFGGEDCEISIRAFDADTLAAMEAACAEDWDSKDDSPYARVRA